MKYDYTGIEKKWRDKLTSCKISDESLLSNENHLTSGKKNYYVLSMLPYPSGRLHMGHIRNYTIGDVIARRKKLCGYNVLQPIGWDSFGMPAENAAIGGKSHPAEWTVQNIQNMKQQLQSMGYMYDWSREISTCSKEYYSHEQKIFLEMYRKGIIYRTKSYVNWDPVDQTVLANEQVIDGKGWRSGARIEKRILEQWSVKITDYAEKLLQSLDDLRGYWPDNVIKMQENWIGKSIGALIDFKIADSDDVVQIYTTRPDTLYGSSFVALAADHELSKKIAIDNEDIQSFITKCKQIDTSEEAMSKMEKLGFDTGLKAINPLSGRKIPIFVANFVLMDYGTGAIFGCPAHDQRDHEFAAKYKLEVIPVIRCDHDCVAEPYTGDGIHINSEFLNNLNTEQAKQKIIDKIEEIGIGEAKTMYRLRDWLVSRQRYWGCPIPIIHCDKCGMTEAELPVVLPDNVVIDGNGNPLEKSEWKHVECPKCGGNALRETDTLDTFFESSWYFLRYLSPHNSDEAFSRALADMCMPVDICIGGVEHAVLHLLYARFFMIVLAELGYISDIKTPFSNLLTQGMVCHKVYKTESGEYVYPEDVIKGQDGSLSDKTGRKIIELPCEKMSKSKKNIVSPDDMIKKYGVDALRLFILSDTPPEKNFDWNDDALEGSSKFLNRVYKMCCTIGVYKDDQLCGTLDKNDAQKFGTNSDLIKTAHQYLRRINESYDTYSFNKSIALCRELFNVIEGNWSSNTKETVISAIDIFLMSMYAICPYLTSEIWSSMHNGECLQDRLEIKVDERLSAADSITIVVQLNGKTKDKFECIVDADNEIITEKALNILNINRQDAKNIIVVKGRLVNVVM